MLWKRIATSILLAPVIWALVWLPQDPIPWIVILMSVWALGALFEFYRIANATGKCCPLTYPGLLLAFLIIAQPVFGRPEITWLAITTAIVVPLIWVMLLRDKSVAFVSWAWTLAGIMYLGWLASHYVALRGLEYGKEWVIFALFTTFVSDSAAYFVGSAIGRHKLAPAISPKKTWEGAIGGIAGAVIASILLQWWLRLPISNVEIAILGAAVSLFGQIGDLVESLFKRNTGAKDSSQVLPGHGGFLDRIDSVVFAGLLVYYYVILTQAG